VVSIRRAERNKVVVHDHNGVKTELQEDLSAIDLKALAKNGTDVTMIELWSEAASLPEDVAFMDTPGIDSTDDAHRVATESALYVADAVIYMMDYNHVQSEVNMAFTKMLVDRGKLLYIVVNQIDKHLDFELDFTEFRESVVRAFHLWGVHPDAFFFTSVEEPDHPDNDLQLLQQQLNDLYEHRKEVVSRSAKQLTAYLIDEHGRWLSDMVADERAALESDLNAIYMQLADCGEGRQDDKSESGNGDQVNDANTVGTGDESSEATSGAVLSEEALLRVQDDVQKAIESNRRALDGYEDAIRREVNGVVNTARLILFRTTELAEAYVASMQQGFRVGWLNVKTKTQEERKERLAALYEDVRNQVSASLEWHLRDTLLKLAEDQGAASIPYRERVARWMVPWDEQLLSRLVQPGAGTSPEYIRNYTRDIDHALKDLYRKSAYGVADERIETLKVNTEARIDACRARLTLVRNGLTAIKRLESFQANQKDAIRELKDLAEGSARCGDGIV